MDHDRISALLSSTPSGTPDPEPDRGTFLRRVRQRRVRRVAAASFAGGLAVVGLVVPLTLLAGVGDRGHAPGPGPAASATADTSPAPAPSVSDSPTPPPETGGAIPNVGVFRCTADGIETDTPEFAVQPDGIHLQVGNPWESSALILRATGSTDRGQPFDVLGNDGFEFVTPFLEPGTYQAACELAGDPDAPSPIASGDAITVHIVDPAGIWSVIDLPCADTTERVILVGAGVDDRSEVPALIRRGVDGVEDGDVIVPAGYPQSDEDIAYVIHRDSRNVAVVRALGRDTPLAQALDVTSCDGSGIGEGQGGR